MKKCPRCEKIKQLVEFNFRNKATGELQPHCRVCQQALTKESYRLNRQHYIDKSKVRSTQQQEKYNRWKQTLLCCVCAESHSWCIEFHHTDSGTKEGTVSSFARRAGGKKFVEELSKCIVVCANCHRKLHAGDLILDEDSIARSKSMVATFEHIGFDSKDTF